jgi:hypothetical protein
VYKLSKALYRLKQAPRARYARLKTLLLEHRYVMGSVDKILFTLNHGTDFLLVQIYVDDIIFGGSSHTLVSKFQEMMESEFQMSMMGELIFFLGIQVKQMNQGTFVHQAKYTKDLMKNFNMAELKPVSTPMSSAVSLGPDEARYLRASSQVHEGPNEELQYGGAQASVYSDELRHLAWFR